MIDDRPALGRPSSVVCVSGRGGCGASLLSAGLALAWARAGRRPLLVDLDLLRGDLAPSWSVPAERTLADLVPVLHELEAAHLRRVAFPHPSGASLIAAASSPRAAAWTAPAGERLIRAATTGWDGVVADLGSGDSRAAPGAATAAAHVLLVCPPTIAGARRARTLAGLLERLGATAATAAVIGPVSSGSELTARGFNRAAGIPVVASLPRSETEARDIAGGRWAVGRRRPLTAAIAAIAEAVR